MNITADRPATSILEDIAGNIQTMIRSEVRLAKAELREETIKAGKAAGLLGFGALTAVYALGFLLLACLFALEIVLPAWLSALIVTVLVGILGAALVGAGINRMKQIDPRPDKTIESVKENIEWAKNQVR